MKYLIVNGDDFGASHGINRGIVEACRNGILTSASLMVRESAAAEAADYARQHPAFTRNALIHLQGAFTRLIRLYHNAQLKRFIGFRLKQDHPALLGHSLRTC